QSHRFSLFCTFIAVASADTPGQAAKHAIAVTSNPSSEIASSSTRMAKGIDYGEKDVVPVKTKLRFSTLIVLPKTEQILDYICGDKELWVINGNANFAHVK